MRTTSPASWKSSKHALPEEPIGHFGDVIRADMSFRAPIVIPSAERNPETLHYGCHIRFFTPLRSVQNDMTGSRGIKQLGFGGTN